MNTFPWGNVNTLFRAASMKERTLFTRLVCEEGLHYCCVYAFFSRYKQTSMIAARLGVHRTTVKIHKALFREGVYKCRNSERCMEARGLLKKD